MAFKLDAKIPAGALAEKWLSLIHIFGETRLHENDLRQIIDGTEIILPVKLEKSFPGSGFTPDQKIVIALRLVKRGGLKLNL